MKYGNLLIFILFYIHLIYLNLAKYKISIKKKKKRAKIVGVSENKIQ